MTFVHLVFVKRLTTYLLLLMFAFLSFACCPNDGNPDLKLSAQIYPSSANINQSFQLSFTVVNNSTDDCPAMVSTPCQVNLKMIKRGETEPQVNNYENLDGLADSQTKLFNFTVTVGPTPFGPGNYDLTFTIDPFNTSNDAIRDNNVLTSVIIVN